MDYSPKDTFATVDTCSLLASHNPDYSSIQYPCAPYHDQSEIETCGRRHIDKDSTYQTRHLPNEDKINSGHENEKGHDKYKCAVYKRRWYILFAYWMVYFTQALAWNTWGPIALTAKDAFGWNDTDIALLSNWGCITFVFSAFFFSWLLDTKGLRMAVGCAALLNLIGTGVRCLPVGIDHLKWTAHIGQIFIGLAGPVCQGGAPSLSATWFPANQRTTVTAIGTVAAVLGTSVSFLIGPIIVTDVKVTNYTDLLPNGSMYLAQHDEGLENPSAIQNYHYREVLTLLYIECGMALFFCALILCYFPAKPPSPPSISASTQREDFITGAFKLARHREFWLLGLAYSQSLGVGQAWMTQMAIIFEDLMDVHQDTTGMIAFIASMTGIVGAIFFGGCIDIMGGKMKTILLIIQTAGLAIFIWYLLLAMGLIHFHVAMLYVATISLFFLMNGSTPVYYEITVESSYPIAEGIVALTMTWLMNLFGLVFLCVFMVPDIGASWMNYVMLGTLFLSLPLLILHRENYARRSLDVSTKPTANG